MKTNVFQFNMETGDHSNGASPKSQTSRGNFLKTAVARKKAVLFCAISCLLCLKVYGQVLFPQKRMANNFYTISKI